MKRTISFLWFLALAPISSLAADPVDGFASIYNQVFGQESARITPKSSADCDFIGQYGGSMGEVNSLFCHMKYTMKLNTPGTRSKTMNGRTITAKLFNGCNGADGVTYDKGAYVYFCPGGACARAISACFNANDSLSINKGVLMTDLGAMGGTDGAIYAKWDLGTANATSTFSTKLLVDGRFHSRTDGTRTGLNNLFASMIFYSGNGAAAATGNSARFALELNRATNVAKAYMEGFNNAAGSGYGTWNGTAVNDTPATGSCATRAASATDWTYTPSSNGAACAPATTFGPENVSDVAAYTKSGLLGNWNGMPATP